jgi:hypothetical protein
VLRIFIALKIHRLGRVRNATFGSSGKHTNHYTSKANSSYLDLLSLSLLAQLEEDSNNYIFQEDTVPPHFHMAVRKQQNANLPQRWIGRAGANDVV